ncbi:host attachment family protein [Reyranella sp.]|uniref:host attachment family protein n=1 Tax=Reyranella sp. TaxID=1929291 RepID=UPI003BAD8030
MTIIPHRALVVVADGAGAILFHNEGVGGEITLREDRRLSPSHLSDDGPSGVRPPEQTPRQTDEATFAKQLAHELNRMSEQHRFESLVVVADPQTLGQLRPALHKNVERCVALSIAKDLTRHTPEQIAAAIRDAR